jgi:preprotein translocase subunit SecA
MFRNLIKAIGGDPNKKEIQKHSDVVAQVNALEPAFRQLTDAELRAKTDEFRQRLAAETQGVEDPKERHELQQAVLDELLPEAFAAVREAAMRAIGQRHYDVQLIGGIVLHQGKIAEMRTGEGKTLVATLPTYLNALTGRGVHIVTVNDYLARRDARWMGPIYQLLGLSVGVLQEAARTENGRKAFLFDPEKEAAQEDQHQLRLVDRREAYAADIVYGTNHEFGFDYLRDNMTLRREDRVQGERHFAIVDEVDNILIDEARTPLIISGPADEDPRLYQQLAQVARKLSPEDYEIDERSRTVALTEIGEAHVEKLLGQPLRDPDRPEELTPEQARILGHLEQALRAEFLFKRNKDYLVEGGKVIIVDEFTGRKMIGRRWSDGLHQAVEAKEGAPIQAESVTYATITLQNYFRLYAKLAGMSGTALTEAEEFDKIYKLGVVAVPTNLEYQAMRPDSALTEADYKEDGFKFKYFARKDDPEKKPVLWRRKDYADLVYRTEEAKLRAITLEILRRHLHGQPLLVGTTSVELSEKLAERLRAEPLQRLAQVLLIRKAWFETNNKEEDGMLVSELDWLEASLDQLSRQELGKALRDYGLSTNPAGEENAARLVRYIGALDSAAPALARILQAGLKPAVLNAKKHDEESQIIAGAGALGAITIATNMAGRGVDIKLGGELAEEITNAVNRVLKKAGHADPYDYTTEQRHQALLQVPESEWGIYEGECRHFLQTMQDFRKVKDVGGLHVVGSERHEARRIDNQLRGRAARQGDPGSSQFYLSLEDDLMRRFGGQQVSDLMQRLKVDDSVPIQASIVSKIIEGSQTRVEGYNFDTRKHLLEYDDVLNSQRNKIYAQRDRIFEKEDLTDDFLEMVTAEVNRRVDLSETDEEGRWKLFAWLEEAQPSLPLGSFGSAQDKHGEFYPSYMLELMLRDLDAAPDTRTELLDIARAALESEREHLMAAVEAQVDRAEERLDAQIKEKKETAELALEELENAAEESGQPVDANRAYRVVGDTLGLQLRPAPAEARDFNYRQFKKQISGWAEAAVSGRVRSSLVLAIERRVGATLALSNTVKADADWDSVRQQLIAAAEKAHQNKTERSLTEIERELKSLSDAPSRPQLTQTLINMAYGTVAAFDQKTHRKILLRTLRLTYVFLAAERVADWPAAQLKEEIIAHLRGAVDALRQMWGEAEFRRLASLRLADLNPAALEKLRPALPADASDSFTFNDLSPEAAQAVREILGDQLLTQLFRQIMLHVVGQLWVEHLTSVEALRTSIGLEAYAQRDPLVAYKAKASETFQQLLVNMRAGVVARAFIARPRTQAEAPAPQRDKEREKGNGGRAPARPEQKVVAGKTGAVLQPAAPAAQPVSGPAEGEGKKRRRRR